MFPAAHLLLRQATEDNVLLVPKPVGEEGTITVPIAKGTTFIVDMVGAQYNPRYFDEPEKFKPSRWHGLPHLSYHRHHAVLPPRGTYWVPSDVLLRVPSRYPLAGGGGAI
ncbi:unnamed protein product [Mycena citricolor]|uniref:Cytochrome P450 n=1 Tax=Mycena citricolor TaxID=2018698 RepID=A0AAD2GSK6_9AGAR|nr:unnamed protein product [Mycena citricolor]